MKIIKLYALVIGLVISFSAIAQNDAAKARAGVRSPGLKSPGEEGPSKFNVSVGVGAASYLGDLIQGNKLYAQPGLAFSGAISYAFTNKLGARFDVGFQKIKAADSENTGAHKARNLSFKSTIFDFALSGEYTILDLKNFPATPYISAGVGVMVFNSSAEDVTGKKTNLRELGTEGQGLAGYPGLYNNAAVIFPLGIGVKYPINEKMMLALDFTYRFTRTDYLDDVSTSYPDKALLDARNPVTATFTWRGNEVGAGSYPPKNNTLPRGNPKDKDGYYSTQLKFIFNL